ncbi:MAG: ketol-acid reductoisomerase [Anaerolineae bacterium]|jgi:ketol-acid reductoisomerase|nr:ketol-acid reductoisomerase [Anaerolineae bacterium]
MPVIYRDSDANLGLLMDRTITVLGYGNMGHAIALNLRDSAFPVLIGNQDDSYAMQAYHDGFEVASIADAVARSNLLLLMLPDEIAAQVYLRDIAPGLNAGDTLVFASGYNIAFGFIEPPPFVDVVMVAPQAVGQGVREDYVAGVGFPSFVAVAQDASGDAWARVLAVAKALGALHRGAFELTFQQEAVLDLFTQQALLPAFHSILQAAIAVLNREGFPPEAILTALYLSGELGYIISKWAESGVLPSMELHSLTNQYGTLSHIERFKEVKLARQMETILDSIRRGDFAQEWAAEYADGYPRLKALRRRLQDMSIWQHEQEVLSVLTNPDTP